MILVAIALIATDINTSGGLWLSITRSLGNAGSVDNQILVSRMKGQAATIREQMVRFEDEPLLDKLVAIYWSGVIRVDAPEEMGAIAPPEQLATITKNGNQVTLPYVDIVVLGKMAQNQWATGQVVARVVSPRPGYGG